MTFQQSISLKQGLGVAGELYDNGPHRAEPFILDSASAAYNVFGRAFSITSEGKAAAGNTGSAVFAGYLVSPKSAVSVGTSVSPLAATLAVPDHTSGTLLNMGCIIATLPASAALGDYVVYDNTTGVLETIAPGADLPAGKSPGFATVDRLTVSEAGNAVIRVLTFSNTPVLAA
jgi:hypothetical protein